MNHNEQQVDIAVTESLSSLESDSKNYKSLFEEIAQNNTKIYLDNPHDLIRYVDESHDDKTQRCCCCKVHRRNSSLVNKIPIYNTIFISEMKNATDYLEYLNETRRNSFNSLNRDNRSNYYRLLLSDANSNDLTMKRNECNHKQTTDFLQVPKINVDEQLRRTPEFEDISKKIDQIHTLDSSCSALIIKSIEVHADILVSESEITFLKLFGYLILLIRLM